MNELEMLRSQNKLLQGSVDILSRQLAIEHQRGRASEYVEARAERIADGISTAISQFEKFKRDIVAAVHGRLEAERKLRKLKNFKKKRKAKKRK